MGNRDKDSPNSRPLETSWCQERKGLIWYLQIESQSQIRNWEEIRLSSWQLTLNGKEDKLEHEMEKGLLNLYTDIGLPGLQNYQFARQN